MIPRIPILERVQVPEGTGDGQILVIYALRKAAVLKKAQHGYQLVGEGVGEQLIGKSSAFAEDGIDPGKCIPHHTKNVVNRAVMLVPIMFLRIFILNVFMFAVTCEKNFCRWLFAGKGLRSPNALLIISWEVAVVSCLFWLLVR
jgi:hypothetical protein